MSTPAKQIAQARGKVQGDYYQTVLLTLVALRFRELNKEEGCRFELAGNKLKVGCFDDICANYNDVNEQNHGLFIQVKHSKCSITVSKLLTTNTKDPFQLVKYFCSFIEIQKHHSSVQHCVIATNTNFEIENNLVKCERRNKFEGKFCPKELCSNEQNVYLQKILNVGGTFYKFEKAELLEHLKNNFKWFYNYLKKSKKNLKKPTIKLILTNLESLLENDERFNAQLISFLDNLVFVVNLPKGDDVYDIIGKRIIGKEFLMYDTNITDNMFKKIINFMKANNLDENFLSVEEINNLFLHNKHTIDAIRLWWGLYFKLINLNIDVKENIKESLKLEEFLENDNEHKLHLITDFTLVGAAIISKIFEDIRSKDNLKLTQYIYDNTFRFFNLDKLLKNKTLTENVLNTFKESWNLLIMVCNTEEDVNSIERTNLFINLEKIVEHSRGANNLKKIIFIGKKEYKQMNACKQKTLNIQFSDLKQETQRNVLHKVVDFQGEEIKLLDLFGCNNDFSEPKHFLVRMVTLEWMLNEDEIKIGKPVCLDNLEGTFHKCSEKIVFDQLADVLSQSSCNKFLISNVNPLGEGAVNDILFKMLGLENDTRKKQLIEDKFWLLNENNEQDKRILVEASDKVNEKEFKKYCKVHPKEITYWIRCENNEFELQELYKPNFYIKRIFFQEKKIISSNMKSYLLDTDLRDLFIFKNVSENDLSKLLKIRKTNLRQLIDSKIVLINSDEKVENSQHYENVYVFAISNKDIILQKYSGSLRKLNEYIVKPKTKNEVEKIVMEEVELFQQIQNEKMTVLVSEAGMGKSTTLMSLSKSCLSTHWTIYMYLKLCQDAIEEIPETITIQEVVKFLKKVLSFSLLEEDLATFILKEKMHIHKKNLLLLFDGFDEIKSGKEKVLSLLKFLKDETTAIVWVTSRNYELKTLHNGLLFFPTQLGDFSLQNQKTFLEMHWKPFLILTLDSQTLENTFNFKNRNNDQETKFDLASKALLDTIMKEVKKKSNTEDYGMAPLLLFLLAESFQDEFKMFVHTQNNDVSNFENFNVLTIYEKFVNAQYERYFVQQKEYKNNLKDTMIQWVSNKVDKCHQKLAMKDLFSDIICNLLQISFTQNDMNELFKVGLILSNEVQNIRFIHPTFAEFFAAKFFAGMLSKKKDNPTKYTKVYQFLLTHISKKKYVVFNSFFMKTIMGNGDVEKEWSLLCKRNLLKGFKGNEEIPISDLDPNSSNSSFISRGIRARNNDQLEIYKIVDRHMKNEVSFEIGLQNLGEELSKVPKKKLDSYCLMPRNSKPEIFLGPKSKHDLDSLFLKLDVSCDKDLKWLTNEGVCIAKSLTVLTPEMSNKFNLIFVGRIKMRIINIIFNLLRSFLSIINYSEDFFDIDPAALLSTFQCLVKFCLKKKLVLNNVELASVIKCIVYALDKSLSIADAVLSLMCLRKWDVKAFDFEEKLVIVDLENDYHVQIQDSTYKKQIVELLRWIFENGESNFKVKCETIASTTGGFRSVQLL